MTDLSYLDSLLSWLHYVSCLDYQASQVDVWAIIQKKKIKIKYRIIKHNTQI